MPSEPPTPFWKAERAGTTHGDGQLGGAACRLRLVSIPVSHYCEKARWALERAGLPYEELRHVQLFHYAATFWYARSAYAPALLTPAGAITDSTAILRYVDLLVDAPLFPREAAAHAQVSELEELFDRVVGVESRRWLYRAGFEHLGGERMVAMAAQGTPAWQAPAARVLAPFARWFLHKRLDIGEARVERGLEQLWDVFERVGQLLRDGRRYLTGDQFTAADLSFAALSALVLMPPEYGVRLAALDELPAAMRAVVERFRETHAGEFALRLYAQERRIRV